MTFSCNYLLPSSFTAPESGPQLVVHRTVLPKSVQRLSQPSTSLMRFSYHFQLCIFIGTKMKKKREIILFSHNVHNKQDFPDIPLLFLSLWGIFKLQDAKIWFLNFPPLPTDCPIWLLLVPIVDLDISLNWL